MYKIINCRDFFGGPVVKNSLSNAGDVGLIPGQGACCGAAKPVPHNEGQHSLNKQIVYPVKKADLGQKKKWYLLKLRSQVLQGSPAFWKWGLPQDPEVCMLE